MRAEHLDPEVVGVLNHGQSDGRVVQFEAAPARTPRRVDLEGRHETRLLGLCHSLEPGGERPEVGRHDVLQKEPRCAASGLLDHELAGGVCVGEGESVGRFTGARQVGEKCDGGVARQKDIVNVRGLVDARERIRRHAMGRQHVEHQLHGLGRLRAPRQARHHMVGVHVEDELSV